MAKEKGKEPTLKEDLEEELREAGFTETANLFDEFDLLAISDEAENLSKEIAKRVRDRIETYTRLLEELLQPDSGLSAMNECSFFDEKEHEAITANYRLMMSLLRSYTMADLKASRTAYKEFTKTAIPAWLEKKAWFQQIVKHLHDAWKNGQPLSSEKCYFG